MSLTITIPGAVNVTTGAMAPAVLTIGVGVPGAAGPAGPAGPGVPAGGSAGQFLQKIDGVSYNTDWVTVNLGAYAVKANNLSDLTSAPDARTNLGLGTMATATAADYSTTTVANGLYYPLSTNPAAYLTASSLTPYLTKADNLGSLTNFATARDNLGLGTLSSPTFAGVTVQGAGANVANLTPTSLSLTHATSGSFTIQPSVGITFPDASVQTTAFTGIPAGYITSVSSPLSVTSGNLSVDLSAYLTTSTAASTYQTLSGMSSYLTTSTAASTYAALAGATFTGKVTTIASTTGTAPLNIPHGSFPTTPSNGDIWTTGTGIFSQVNGSAFQFAQVASPGFSGVPTAPTATAGTSTTQIATTAFVTTADNLKANLASPTFSGTPSLPTGTIAVTQTAGNNTTALATTAFVTAAVPATATVAEALRPSSATLAMTPDTTREMLMYPGYLPMYGGGVISTSGAGASGSFTFATQRWHELVGPNTATAGYSSYTFDSTFSGVGMVAMTRGVGSSYRKWNSKIWASGRSMVNTEAGGYVGDANTFARVMVGGRSSIAAGGMVASENGIGWKVAGGGSAALVLTVSNGSTLTETTSSFTPTGGQVFDWKIYSDGAGNVTLWVNDTQVATSTGGPTTSTAEQYNMYLEIVDQTASATARFVLYNFGTKVFWSQA